MPANEFLVLWLSSWAAIAFFFASRRRSPCAGGPCRPHYRGPGLYPARCLCRAGRQRLGKPWGPFDAGLWPAVVPWIAAAGVVVVAIKTKSMLWCCVSGIVLYIALSLV